MEILKLQEVETVEENVKIVRKSSKTLKVEPRTDLDLTGSPLKMSFTLDDDEDDDDFEAISVFKRPLGPSFHPLKTSEAR